VNALQRGDIPGLSELLQAEVALELPPFATWFQGRNAVLGFLAEPGQPAVLAWVRDATGEQHPHGVQLLDVERDAISRIVSFNDPGVLALF
jgi:RNA polymerase sigma-70 factor (ECF subfamily)